MPVTTVGFSLKPFGFFDGNPALDLPNFTSHCPPTDGTPSTRVRPRQPRVEHDDCSFASAIASPDAHRLDLDLRAFDR